MATVDDVTGNNEQLDPGSGLIPAIERIEGLLASVFQRIAILAVAAILVISLSTIVDIVMRTFFGSSIYGLNENVTLLVAVGASTCLPYGLARGSALTMDLISNRLSNGWRRWIDLSAPVLVGIFFFTLGLQIWQTAYGMAISGDTTMITQTPKAPFFFVMAASCLAVAALQVLIGLRLGIAAYRDAGWIGRGVATALLALTLHAVLVMFGFMSGDFYTSLFPTNPIGLAIVAMAALWALIIAGVPIGISMGLVGIVGSALLIGSRSTLQVTGFETTLFITRDGLSVLPLFLLMGAFAGVAGIGKELYALSNALVGHIRGGLAHASILACALFGTLTGSSIATQMSIGKIALFEMRDRNYSTALSAGSVAAGGTLGQLIPPSSALILYAILTEQSVGQLFIGAIIPGILAAVFYMAAVTVWLWFKPVDATPGKKSTWSELAAAGRGSWTVLMLLGLVLGGIYTGLFTELEGGAVGAFGAFLIALFRGRLSPKVFWKTMGDSTSSLSMIYSLIFGAVMLSFFFGISGVPDAFTNWITGLGLSPLGVVLALVACYLILGTVMDPFAMMIITIPFFVPLVTELGYDPIWWGIMTIMCMEAGMISPPFGLNMFVISSLDKTIPITTVYRGSWPFFFSTIVKIGLLIAFPALVTFLPSTM